MMSTIKNKFQQVLNQSVAGIKEVRGKIINQQAETNAKMVIFEAEKELNDMKSRYLSLTDIYPDSQMTLRVTSDNFDSKTWFADAARLQVEIELKEQEVDIYKKEYDKWFGEDAPIEEAPEETSESEA